MVWGEIAETFAGSHVRTRCPLSCAPVIIMLHARNDQKQHSELRREEASLLAAASYHALPGTGHSIQRD